MAVQLLLQFLHFKGIHFMGDFNGVNLSVHVRVVGLDLSIKVCRLPFSCGYLQCDVSQLRLEAIDGASEAG